MGSMFFDISNMTEPQTADLGTALLRISMGFLFLCHVGLRLMVITWPVAVQFFQSLGLPWFIAYAVTITEASVGIMLVLGWHVRVAALAGASILLGATVLVHFANGFLFTNAGGGWEYPAFWAVALMCQAMLGTDRWSIEYYLRREAARPTI